MMFGFSSILGPAPAPPAACPSCGAQPGKDHAKDCPVLSVVRAQHYPEVIDDNGSPWYLNAIAERDRKIAELTKQLEDHSA
jgi:hypothetical protein